MKKEINLAQWERKEHYEFFVKFTEPFWGVCANVDCTVAYANAKKYNRSFYLSYLYFSLKAANEIKEFKYRISGEKVFCYDTIHASPTVDRDDGTFDFAVMLYKNSLDEFILHSKNEIEKARSAKGLNTSIKNEDVIHYSTVPWINFTSISHARHFGFNDSIPKITFGKVFNENGNKKLPIAVHVNHALVDGIHVGNYLELLQKYLNE